MKPTTNLRDKNLRMKIKDSVARINWARKVHENIYEIGVFFESGRLEGGSQNWYVEAEIGKGFIPIECSMYITTETKLLRMADLINE